MNRPNRMRMLTLAAILAGAWQGTMGVAKADEAALAANLGGIDGIVTRCVVSSDKRFVSDMCDALAGAAAEQGRSAGLDTAATPITWERAPDDAYRNSVVQAGFGEPLLIEFFVRGTDGNPAAASIHVLASVLYDGAIEVDGGGVARSGRLVIWEEAGTSSGPPNQLAAALSAFVAGKMDPLFKALRSRQDQ